MLVKTFQAGEMSEALKMVKAELGRDAMILSSKKERRKGIMGLFSKPYFEVTAALDPRPAPRPEAYREQQAAAAERELSTREEFQNSMLGPLAREVRELKQRLEALSRKEAMEAGAQAAEREAQPLPQEAAAELPPALKNFGKDELEEIKKLLYNAVAGRREKQQARPFTFPSADAASDQPVAWQPVLEEIEAVAPSPREEPVLQEGRGAEAAPAIAQDVQRMLEQLNSELKSEDVGPEAIELLLNEITPAAAGGVDLDELRQLLSVTMEGMIKCSGSLRLRKKGPRIIAMVGPAGVGKSTTIAKLAALHGLERGASVALVTTDNFRVGAVEQLKSYARIMDLPLEVAGTSQELAEALARHADKNLVLIDTAGRSHHDQERLDELKGYLECQAGIDVYLCLSATTRSREIDETVATFRALRVSKIVFTKLDESRSFGCIVDTALKHKMPLCYFSTGQRVPEDLEVATARKLVSLVVKEPPMSGELTALPLPLPTSEGYGR